MNSSPRNLIFLVAFTYGVIFTFGAASVSSRGQSLLELQTCSTADPANKAAAMFSTENDSAMKKMMKGMAAKPSGNVDVDFVAMMVPHHQGAIDMAIALLRYGHNEQLRRLAQEIIVTQNQEIGAMRIALGEPLPPPGASPTQVAGSSTSAAPIDAPAR